jgi:hypothetical protein
MSVIGRAVTVRVSDPDSQSTRSKAPNARGAQIFSYVGEEPPADQRAYRFECFASRTTAQILFPNDVPSGATVWLSARWVNARGETSPASPPLGCTLQGGAIGPSVPSLLRAAA